MAIELISFDDLKVFLGLQKTEVDYPELTLIQETVVDMFQEFTGRVFEQGTYTDTKMIFCGKTRMIKLDALPVDSVSQVLVNNVATTEYKIRPYGIELGLWVEDLDVEVTYIGGIETVPGTLRRAALLQTVYEFQNKDSIGIETVSSEGGTVTKPELGMLKEVAKLLRREIHPFPVF